MTVLVPPSGMPATGASVLFRVTVWGGDTPRFQWLKDGRDLPGATDASLILPTVSFGDAGAYQVRVSDKQTTLLSPAFPLEPVDQAWVVRSAGDEGPDSLREVLARSADFPGMVGIQFAVPGAGPLVIRLQRPLEPITGKVCLLGPLDRPLTLDGGGRHRPFFVAGGTLILDNFTVANGLGKGGDGPGGGGGAAGMGGAVFVNEGELALRRMRFVGNRAVGGGSAPGTDGENGGGGGFGGDAPALGGHGGPSGWLRGTPGLGHLDGSNFGGGPAFNEDGAFGGAGGGAARGGPANVPVRLWLSDNLPGGDGNWGAGGGFSVGPEGGGGAAGAFGGGGGGSGGRALQLGPGGLVSVFLEGAAKGDAGVFGGEGGMGDGVTGGRGGGGGAMGGALFLRDGELRMHACEFQENQAIPGQGAEDGLGKGGAVFIYAVDPSRPFSLETLKAQTYAGNVAADLAEDPAFDNENWYVAQEQLARRENPSLTLRYRFYRLERAMGWPISSRLAPRPWGR